MLGPVRFYNCKHVCQVVSVLKAKVAIELAESPTWRASCRCLPPSLLRDTLSSKVCR